MSGRPTKITPQVVSLLADCLRQGMTVREACLQAVISHDAYYSRLKSDQQFADIMARAQMQPTITARRVLVEQINAGNVSVSKWWLERKEPHEFSLRREIVTPEVEEEVHNPFKDMSDEDLYALADEYMALRTGFTAYPSSSDTKTTPVV